MRDLDEVSSDLARMEIELEIRRPLTVTHPLSTDTVHLEEHVSLLR